MSSIIHKEGNRVKPKRLDPVCDAIRLKHYSIRTEDVYLPNFHVLSLHSLAPHHDEIHA